MGLVVNSILRTLLSRFVPFITTHAKLQPYEACEPQG